MPVNDASVISRTLQERKAKRTYDLTDELHHELSASGGEVTKKVAQLQHKLAKEREVETQVSHTGNTSPSSAVQMLPDRRGKQERFFPSITPDEARVTYLWHGPSPDGVGRSPRSATPSGRPVGTLFLSGVMPVGAGSV